MHTTSPVDVATLPNCRQGGNNRSSLEEIPFLTFLGDVLSTKVNTPTTTGTTSTPTVSLIEHTTAELQQLHHSSLSMRSEKQDDGLLVLHLQEKKLPNPNPARMNNDNNIDTIVAEDRISHTAGLPASV